MPISLQSEAGYTHGPFGIKPPSRSTRFTDPGNVSTQNADGTATHFLVNKGRVAPTADSENHAFTIASGGEVFGRSTWPERVQDWASNVSAHFGGDTVNNFSLIYYHLASNYIYFLCEVGNVTATFVKLDMSISGGTFTEIATISSAQSEHVYEAATGRATETPYIRPLDINNPDTGDWEVVMRPRYNGTQTIRTVYNFSTDTEVSSLPLKFDAADTNQDIDFPCFYISQDNTVLLGGFKMEPRQVDGEIEAYQGQSGMFMNLSRGNTQYLVRSDDLGAMFRGGEVGVYYNIGLWGEDDILFYAENGATNEPIGAGKILDRADFDRFLNDILDVHGASPAQAYF
jgi:hypothetical protein